MDYRNFIDRLDDFSFDADTTNAPEEKLPAVEIVVDAKTGRPRQAGADGGTSLEGRYVNEFRSHAERSLFAFARGVLGLSRLNDTLHWDVCRLLTHIPPYRKLVLLPRDHLKTSIVSRAMPIHILIQPREHNIYRLGCQIKDCPDGAHCTKLNHCFDGGSTRILLSNETATNAEHFLRWTEARFETNRLLRALWPHRCWESAQRQSPKWSAQEMTIPREDDYPEASIETIGVGGAITSRHYDILIKDDLISIEAANSPLVMQDAIQWHIASRALMDDPDKSLEFIVGTRWAAMDLYSFILNGGALGASEYEPDHSVEVYHRAAIEDGEPIFPQMFSLETLLRLQKENGPALFSLLYMNNAANPELTDFDMGEVRHFEVQGSEIMFDEDARDASIAEALKPSSKPPPPQDLRGLPLNKHTMDMVMGRGEYFRLKHG